MVEDIHARFRNRDDPTSTSAILCTVRSDPGTAPHLLLGETRHFTRVLAFFARRETGRMARRGGVKDARAWYPRAYQRANGPEPLESGLCLGVLLYIVGNWLMADISLALTLPPPVSRRLGAMRAGHALETCSNAIIRRRHGHWGPFS